MHSHTYWRANDELESSAVKLGACTARPDVLLFDLCGVLFDDTIWTRWLFQLVSRVGARLCYDQFVRVWDERFSADVTCGRRDYWEAVFEYLLVLNVPRAAADELCVAARARRRQFDESIRPLPGTKAGLATLAAQGHRLAVIGNVPCDTAHVRQRVAHLGLNDFFCEILSSFDLGRGSAPDSRYCQTAQRLATSPECVWFVSGSESELRDAAAQGLTVVAWQLTRTEVTALAIDHLHNLLSLTGRPHSLAG